MAKAAGVSVATVSRVISKADYPVAEATRQRVRDAARHLGFMPNALARGLARSRTDTIGIVVPGITNPYYAAMVETIDRSVREIGLRTLLGLTSGNEERREEIIDDLVSRRVDGLIICAGADDNRTGRPPHQLGIPAILVGEQANAGHAIIKTDNFGAGYNAIQFLWSLGHRTFLYLTSLESWHDFHQRGQGMRAFLRSRTEPYEFCIEDGLFGEADTYRRMSEICKTGLGATAVLASTDRHALGTLAALEDAHHAVPAAVSVMGFDDYVTSGFIRPALTTMRMPVESMGQTAVLLLRDSLEGRGVREQTLFQAELIERKSTAFSPPM